jgi:FAD/FMN-containing dehydrogenase
MLCNRAAGLGPTINNSFTNWAQNVSANPQIYFQPNTIDELVAIVRQAEANHVSVRAVGSGWSFTDVMVSPDYMVNTDLLSATLSETLTGTDYSGEPVFASLTPLARSKRLLYHVEAGIKVHDLYERLEQVPGGILLNDGLGGQPRWHGYALKTLGGSGGQSIAGAVSTSTHGGDDHDSLGTAVQPLPDMVQGLHLVGAGGAEFFIQRGGG